MSAKRQLPTRVRLTFWVIWTGFAGVMWVVTMIFLVGDLSGGNATATVLHVYSQEAYTIGFTTEDGAPCVTPHKWIPRSEPVELGDTFPVHYSRISPCDNVERADDLFARYGMFLIPTVLFAAGCVNLRRTARGNG